MGWFPLMLSVSVVFCAVLPAFCVPPDVQMFAKKSVSAPEKLTLFCMVTGFYPKHIEMNFRKYRTTLPDHLLTSSGVRPNGDGTYKLRKSVEIMPEDKELYKCYVNHITLNKPIIIDQGEGDAAGNV